MYVLALDQLLGLLLPPEYVQAVPAVLRALPPSKHGSAEEVVVLQRLPTLRVGGADPPGLGAGDNAALPAGPQHWLAAGLHARLGHQARVVLALTLRERKKKKKKEIESLGK